MTFLVGWLTLACKKNDKTVDKGQKIFIDSDLEVYPLLCINLTCSNKNKYVYIKVSFSIQITSLHNMIVSSLISVFLKD